MEMLEKTYVKVVRGKHYVCYFRKYKIFINDQEEGKIAREQEVVIQISPGTHTIYTKVDWVKSNAFEFDINAGQTIVFRCGGDFNQIALLEYIGYE
jgi:hypothetical protein